MADLNALIAQGAQFQAPQDPFAQYAQMQQLDQNRQANQLNRMKMEEAQAAAAERNALRQLNPASSDYEAQLFRVNPTIGIAYRKEASAAAAQKSTSDRQSAETTKFHLDNSRSLLVGVNDQPAYDAWRDNTVKNLPDLDKILPTVFSPEIKDPLLITAADISKRLTAQPTSVAAGGSMYDPKTGTFTQAPEKTPAPPSMVAEYNFAKTPDGGRFVGSYQQFVTARAAAGRAPAAPRPEQPPVAVEDPVSGKQVLVTREEALRRRMTPAAAMESLSPKEIQKREAALPQATSATKGFESKADKFIADLTALRNDSGLDNITGPVFGRTGSVTQAGSRAQALYDKVVAKGGFQALQDLRDASKTGGALGNVSNQEGKQLTSSFAAIDRRQNAEDVRAAIDNAIADIQGTKTRMREAYDSTYSYKSSGTSEPGKPAAAAPNIDALLNKYK